MWWSLIPTVLKTGAEIYKNHKQSEFLESEAERKYYERMAKGEIEYQRDVTRQVMERRICLSHSNTSYFNFSLVNIFRRP